MGNTISRHLLAGTVLALAFTASACVKDNSTGPGTVTRDAAFIGYSTPETKQTTCGNCHISLQRSWVETKHASAWSDLQASGHAGASCNPCHTVSGYSNAASDTAGFPSVSDASKKYYQDVQCEACHGPGTTHVSGPDETQPIPYFASIDTVAGAGCGTCHSGTHNPFVEEWSMGAHGTPIAEPASPARGYACQQCHEGKVILQRFGGSNVYVEATNTTIYPQTCVTCHDPHNKTNDHQLRFSVSERDENNLCIQCHHKRGVPDLATTRGAHSPQGQILLGYAGWKPAGFVWDTVANRPAHADAGNPDLCAGCHVFRFSVNNAQGKFLYQSTGHTFFPTPCLKADGTPDTTNTCADASRSFKACANGGCHGSEASARSALAGSDSTLQILVKALWVDVNGNGKIDTLPIDSGMLASTKIASNQWPTRSATTTANLPLTVAEGARFNATMVNTDGSKGAHNPRYLQQLLRASIIAVNQQYGVAIPPLAARTMERLGTGR